MLFVPLTWPQEKPVRKPDAEIKVHIVHYMMEFRTTRTHRSKQAQAWPILVGLPCQEILCILSVICNDYVVR